MERAPGDRGEGGEPDPAGDGGPADAPPYAGDPLPDPRALRRAPAVTRWARSYRPGDAGHDLVAGLTVGVLLIPQSMAYAMLAGVPPIYGLYASLVPLVVYPFLGTSRQLAVGIIAIDMLLVHSGLAEVAAEGTGRYLQLAVLLAALTGLIQLAMAVTRLGFLVNLLSRPVMVGFTSGAAVVIAVSQLEGLTGVAVEGSGFLPALIVSAVRTLPGARPLTLLVGGGALVLILTLRRWAPKLPSGLVVALAGTILVWALELDAAGLEVVGDVPAGLPSFALPLPELDAVRALLPTAFTLAFVQFLTVISLGKVFARRHGYRISANSELAAVGAANLAGSLFRSLPVSGSFSRTALNAQAGARSPMANVVAALVVVVVLLFFTHLLAYVPVAVLAAIIVVAALGLVDLPEMRFIARAKTSDGWVAVLTFGATLLVGIQEGILVGVMASVLVILVKIGRPRIAELGHIPGTRAFRDVRYVEEARAHPDVVLLRIDQSFSFMNAEYLRDRIEDRTAEGTGVRAIVLDASGINDLDTTALEIVLQIRDMLQRRRVELHFAGLKRPVRKILARSGLQERFGEHTFHLNAEAAVRHILGQLGTGEDYLGRFGDG